MNMKKKLKFIYILISFIIITLIIGFSYKEPKINLLGDEIITIELNTQYVEPGYNATFLTKDITNLIVVEHNININKIGRYIVTYKLNYKNKEYLETRTVKVIDSVNPVINLLGDGTIQMCPNQEYNEYGFSAFDEYDGDITKKVQMQIENDSIQYYVEDSSNNKTIQERKIIRKDEQSPTIKLKGYQELTMYVNDTYFEAGYEAFDNCDGNITENVKIDGIVDTTKTGKYILTYTIEDSSNNKVTTNRIINILEEPNFDQKTIYLTFDDGPSNTTIKILDILKKDNIKATFFVTNADSKYDEIIKRAFDEGHTIGLHSYSHKYKSIYKSEEAYFDDLKLIDNKVKKITGKKSNIIRFPGGSSNTISRISRGLMTKLSIKTKEHGYIYYDWNIASSDTSRISSDKIVKNVVKQLGNYQTNIILMHDFKNNNKTVNALQDIIQYGKQNEYRFDKITEMTPQIKHKIRN